MTTTGTEPLRVIIAGGRLFSNKARLFQACDIVLAGHLPSVIVLSGTAKGADTLGEEYASRRNLQVERYPADWDRHGKRAGHLRNALMADNAHSLIAFWDEQSRGTKNMIDQANSKGLRTFVVCY